VAVPELKRSVFVIPLEFFKVTELILNDVAWSIAEAKRGAHARTCSPMPPSAASRDGSTL
jgi:hypothetical protein